MTNPNPQLPDDFDTWPQSAQEAYLALYERTQAAEHIVHTMQSTFSDDDTISSLLEQDITPSWRTIMLHTLNDLFRKAATSLDLQEVLETVTRMVAQMLHATSAYICDWDAKNKTVTVLSDYISDSANEAEQHSDVGQVHQLNDDFVFRLNRQEYWISHYEDELTPNVREEFDTYDIKTVLYVPMIAEDHLIGHIEVWETREKQDYSVRQIEFVTALARQVASIVRTTQLHRALKENDARFRLVMSTMREGLVQVDTRGLIEFANESFAQMLECSVDDLIGKPLKTVWKAKHDLETYETTLERQSGNPLTIHISYAPLMSESKRFLGGVYVYTDVSKRKQAEQSALQLGLEQERVRILTEFVQDASHEFYTPLSNIGTHAYLLRRHLENETYLRYLDVINEQTEAIRSLISALVIMTRLDSITSLQFMKSNMVELLNSVLNRLGGEVTSRQHQLTVNISHDYIPVECDVDMLLLAISNIVDNAIRYTPDNGRIQIELKQEGEAVYFKVEDTGMGMPASVKVDMFKRFYREDTARSTRGFGLGMTITKRIIDLHHGKISVESEQGQGTQITIALPLAEKKNAKQKA